MITKDQTIGQVLQINPKAAQILMNFGMGCLGCPSAQVETIEQACEVHGLKLEDVLAALKEKYDSYKPFSFIYSEMPDVVSCADVVLSRAGANSIWEAAVLKKPMVLIPLCGNGTRGDQVDNSKFFEEKGAALMLLGEAANSENLQKALNQMLVEENRKSYEKALEQIVGDSVPSKKIASILFEELKAGE